MCENCGGIGRVANCAVHGAYSIEPCSCNVGDWETVRKPQLMQIWKEAQERANDYGGMEAMAGNITSEWD